ncbi:MAG: hypothetical protein ACLGRW_10135 [Acidobacteriota bacterium]
MIDHIIILAGLQVEAVLLVLLAGKGIFRTMPVFTAYIGCGLGIDLIGLAIASYTPKWYIHFCIVNAILDAGFFILVLRELGRCVLSHNRATPLPRPIMYLLFAATALVMSSLGRWGLFPHLTPIWQLLEHAFQAAAVIQATAFLTLAFWTSLKGLHWPQREFQVATGLGLYSVVALAVAVVHTHLPPVAQYHWVDLLGPASYLGILVYWTAYFAFETGKASGVRTVGGRHAARDQSVAGSQSIHGRA